MNFARGKDLLGSSVDPSDLPDPTESMRLVSEAQAGSREALEELLRRYQGRLRRIVSIRLSAKLRRCVESMDIVQETFAAAFDQIGHLELRDTASILKWFSRIAENQMLDAHRRFYNQKRDRSREVDLLPEPSNLKVGPGALAEPVRPDREAAQRELERLVDEAVARLPDDYREVIMLRTYYGGSWDYVARETGRPNADAARQLYQRARIRLSRLVRGRLARSPGARVLGQGNATRKGHDPCASAPTGLLEPPTRGRR